MLSYLWHTFVLSFLIPSGTGILHRQQHTNDAVYLRRMSFRSWYLLVMPCMNVNNSFKSDRFHAILTLFVSSITFCTQHKNQIICFLPHSTQLYVMMILSISTIQCTLTNIHMIRICFVDSWIMLFAMTKKWAWQNLVSYWICGVFVVTREINTLHEICMKSKVPSMW